MVGQSDDVAGPVEQCAPGVQGGVPEAGTVDADDAEVEGSGAAGEEAGFDAGAGRAVEVEDWWVRRGGEGHAVDEVGEGAA